MAVARTTLRSLPAPPFLLVPGAGALMRHDAPEPAQALMRCLGDVLCGLSPRPASPPPDRRAERRADSTGMPRIRQALTPDKRLSSLDLGTSGARAVVIDAARREIAMAKSAMADHGADIRDPHVQWAAAQLALRHALAQVDADQVAAIAVDGTSGTMLGVDADGAALTTG